MKLVNLTKGETVAQRVLVADNFLGRLRGLLGRKIDFGEALVLKPCNAIHTFFMSFPIDVVFLDREGRVLLWQERLARGRVIFCPGAHMAVELPAGSIAKLALARGDRLLLRREME